MTATLGNLFGRHPAFQPRSPANLLQRGLAVASHSLDTTQARHTADPMEVGTFHDFVTRVHPRFRWYRHCEEIAAVLQRVADDQLQRGMFWLPPRHSKSEEISRLFTAYYLLRHQERFVGLTSYGAELAFSLSRAARNNYQRAGGVTLSDAAAVRHWETPAGGGMWASGVGGPITGKGFHFGLVDDPVKNEEESASEVIGRRNQDWYRSTFYTRAEPGAAIVVVQTRWPGPGDLCGWLLKEEEANPTEAERWHIVSMEAIKETNPVAVPVTCTLAPDPRQPGEALCPERYPLERLRKIKARLTAFFWSALYQQRPVPKEGTLFKRHWFPIEDMVPPMVATLRAWDKAATQGGGDWTCGVKWGRDKLGVYWVLDLFREQLSQHPRDQAIRRLAETDQAAATAMGATYQVGGEQEPGASGKDMKEKFIQLLSGFDVDCAPSTGSKPLRALPLAAAAEGGNVRMVRAAWNEGFLQRLCDFPYGDSDDDVDAASKGYTKLAQHQPFNVW